MGMDQMALGMYRHAVDIDLAPIRSHQMKGYTAQPWAVSGSAAYAALQV